MSSKLILLREKQTIPTEIRNLGSYEFSLQDWPPYSDFDQDVRLYSYHFCEKNDIDEIWGKALALIDVINGALRLYYLNTDINLYLNPVAILDEKGYPINKTLYRNEKIRLYPFDMVEVKKHLNNETLPPRQHFLNDIIFLSAHNSDLFDLLMLCSLDQNFMNLYKLFETVSFYFKDNLTIELKDGLSDFNIFKSKIRSFKQTANHGNYSIFDLVSHNVRHGRNKNPDDFKKMDVQEASNLVLEIVSVYIQKKYNLKVT